MKKLLLSLSFLAALTAVNAQQRVPLYEVFTSSTCGPCNLGNSTYEGVVSTHNANDYVSVKYQQDFPGTGDPYCTSETVSRRSSYYAINSIPRMEIDGGWDQNAQSFTQALYTSSHAVAAEYNLNGAYTLNATTKTITAKVQYTPLTAASTAVGTKLYVVIVESVTVQNVKTNGETHFYNVVKKMLPNQSGTLISGATIGVQDTMSFNFTFPGNYRLPADGTTTNRINLATENSVENFNNLKVVAWIQGSNKTVFNAANLMKVGSLGVDNVSNTVGVVNVYPNPAKSIVNVSFDMKVSDNVSASIINLQGQVVAQKTASFNAGKNQLTFDTQNLASGFYNVVVLDSKNNTFVQTLSVGH